MRLAVFVIAEMLPGTNTDSAYATDKIHDIMAELRSNSHYVALFDPENIRVGRHPVAVNLKKVALVDSYSGGDVIGNSFMEEVFGSEVATFNAVDRTETAIQVASVVSQLFGS